MTNPDRSRSCNDPADTTDRINQLRHALAKLITKHGWTTRDEAR